MRLPPGKRYEGDGVVKPGISYFFVFLNMHNKKELEPRRKALRNHGTSSEAFLWKHLSKKQLEGKKFRRQHSINNYIVDFFCPSERLIVELDGYGHQTPNGVEYDEKRTDFLEGLDYRVIRFENKMVFDNLASVLTEIKENFNWKENP